MKLNYPIFLLIAGIFIVSSCNKDNSAGPYANDSIPKIQKITEYYNETKQRETSFIYDTSFRLIKVIYNEIYEAQQYYDTLVYSPSSVVKTTFNKSHKLLEQEVFTLNSNHLAIHMTDTLGDNDKSSRNRYKFSSKENESNIYDYDGNGYQTLEVAANEYGGTHRFDKSYSNGNLVSSIYQYIVNDTVIQNGNASFIYYADKKNTIGNENRGISFLGKQNKNLLLSVFDNKWHSSDTLHITTHYSYEFDDHKRVVKQYITSQGEENDDVSYIVFRYR